MFGLFSKKKNPIPVWFKTDIHCHILPGIDDGSPDVETSVELIKGLQGLGIRRIIASPHVAAVQFPNTRETLAESFGCLREALEKEGIDMPVGHSAEYRLDEDLPGIIERGELIPYPGDFVLVENQWIQEPWNLEEVIFNLQIKGFQPILAHPERFTYYHKDMKRLDFLHDKVPFQINLLSLAGYYGKPIKKMAEALLKKGYVDYIGTDTHNQRHLESLAAYLATSDAEKHRELSLRTLKNDKSFRIAK